MITGGLLRSTPSPEDTSALAPKINIWCFVIKMGNLFFKLLDNWWFHLKCFVEHSNRNTLKKSFFCVHTFYLAVRYWIQRSPTGLGNSNYI